MGKTIERKKLEQQIEMKFTEILSQNVLKTDAIGSGKPFLEVLANEVEKLPSYQETGECTLEDINKAISNFLNDYFITR